MSQAENVIIVSDCSVSRLNKEISSIIKEWDIIHGLKSLFDGQFTFLVNELGI